MFQLTPYRIALRPADRPSSFVSGLVLTLLLGSLAHEVCAQTRSRDDEPAGGSARQQAGQVDPKRDRELSEAVRRIERANRGQILSAERMNYEGREVIRLKVMGDDGRVRVYIDDLRLERTQGARQPLPTEAASPPR